MLLMKYWQILQNLSRMCGGGEALLDILRFRVFMGRSSRQAASPPLLLLAMFVNLHPFVALRAAT
jgi:hypothetical protein